METVLLIGVSIVVGLVVGVLSGLLGIGGGTILVPVFKLGYGLSALASTATSLFTIIPTSVSGAITHIKNRTCLPKLGLAAGLGGAITSPIGVWLASISPDWATMVAAAIVIAYSASTMFSKALKLKAKMKAETSRADADLATPEDEITSRTDKSSSDNPGITELSAKALFQGFVIGLVAGVMSGYVGVGGGFLMIPMFMQVIGISMKMTSGTSLIAVMILAIPGTIMQAILGNVNWITGIFVAVGSIPGAMVGAKLSKKVPELTLRYIFSAFLLVAAIMLVINQLGII